MPVLENARHELFAQRVAQGASQREAYLAAGYAPKNDDVADAAASRLLSDVRVSSRVAELTNRAATGTVTTIETLLEAAWSIVQDAQKAEDFGAASITIERLAKIAGLWTDKQQNTTTVDVRSWLTEAT